MTKFAESELIQELATAVAQLRVALEAERVDDYAAGIDRAGRALDALAKKPVCARRFLRPSRITWSTES